MGAAASVRGHEQLTLEQAKELAGKYWDQAQWEAYSTDGILLRQNFKDVIRGADPDFIWSLYDNDASGYVFSCFLSRLNRVYLR